MAISASELTKIYERDGVNGVEAALQGHTQSELSMLASNFSVLLEIVQEVKPAEEAEREPDSFLCLFTLDGEEHSETVPASSEVEAAKRLQAKYPEATNIFPVA